MAYTRVYIYVWFFHQNTIFGWFSFFTSIWWKTVPLVPLIFNWFPHCCSFPDLGPLTQTDLSASSWLHVNMTKRTNRIGDLTRYRVSWVSPEMISLRVHMLLIDYQNYQIQKIIVINKTVHPAYWKRHRNSQLSTNLIALSHDLSLPTIGSDKATVSVYTSGSIVSSGEDRVLFSWYFMRSMAVI
jgi:hypothetical protein